MKNQTGITLIALVITIIVLLILAGVSISAITGENGIVDKAKDAAEKTEAAEKEELERLEGLEELIDDSTSNSKLNKYGFYFEELYKSVTTDSEGMNSYFGYIFYEDGSGMLFEGSDAETSGALLYSQAFPAGTIEYEEFLADVEVSSDGLRIYGSDLDLTCEIGEAHGIYYGEKYSYTFMEPVGEIDKTIKASLIFYEDGTMEATTEVLSDGTPLSSGTGSGLVYNYNGYQIVSPDSEDTISVSADGNYINLGSAIATRDAILENE